MNARREPINEIAREEWNEQTRAINFPLMRNAAKGEEERG